MLFLDVIEYLISIISPEAVNIQNEQGNTALHWAATNGHAKAVECLITKGKADYKVKIRINVHSLGGAKTMEGSYGGKISPKDDTTIISYPISVSVGE